MCKERGLSEIYKNVNESLQMIDQGRRSVQTEKQAGAELCQAKHSLS